MPVTLLQRTAERSWTASTVDNVLIAPLIENSPLPGLNQAGHRAVYHLAIPKTDAHLWEGQLVQFWDRTWAVLGIPTQGIDELIPGPWNKKVVVELYREGAPEPEGLWTDTVQLLSRTTQQDADGYRTDDAITLRAVTAIFTDGVNGAEYSGDDKSGVRHGATVEIWEGDFREERELRFDGRLYRIDQYKPTGRGTLLLQLEEVWR